MKKVTILILTLILAAVTVSGCSTKKTYELALITDLGTINDKSFNQGSWQGVENYAKDNKKTYKYYQPTGESTDDYITQIDTAVQNGAKLIVTPGYKFEEAVYQAQDKYPDVKFVAIDYAPTANNVTKIASNTFSVLYAEEQSGFLAGYAIVKDGYTKLGFVGGVAVPSVIRYGLGYIQGAQVAAAEMGVKVTIKYKYTGKFVESPEIKTLAASWYTDGTEVIFSCGGGIFKSVDAAATEAGKKVIGVDVDQSGDSTNVITSAMKNLTHTVEVAIGDFYAGTFPGGTQKVFDLTNDGVELPMDNSKFKTFTKANYDQLFADLKADKNGMLSNIKKDDTILPASLSNASVTVSYFE